VSDSILLTHSDLDGIGCAVLFTGTLANPGPVLSVENGAIDARLVEVLEQRLDDAPLHDVLVTDHGIREETALLADRFAGAGGRFTLLDHHRSSSHLVGRPWATIDESHSATGLLFRHLGNPARYAQFTALVEDHDLWQHHDPRSSRLASLVGLLGPQRFLARFSADPEVAFREGEVLLLDVEDGRRESYLARKSEQAMLRDLHGISWAICYAESYQSDLAERLMTKFGVQATAIVNAGKRTVSLRGRDFDVSAIAQRQGGGGHARAAAFSFRGADLELDLERFEGALSDLLA
jgi:hypothetical protein